MATICWARTSSGSRGTRVSSIAPRSHARRPRPRTRAGRRGTWGTRAPRLGAPTWWPARPMRCMPRATLRGLSTWITRSTAPMSMPSSRLLVATRAGRRPAFSSSSIRVRCSRARLPWWARATSSSASSLSRRARRSASRRLLTKISVERWARTSSSSSGYIAGQMERRRPSPPGTSMGRPPRAAGRPSSRMSSTGTTTLEVELLARSRRRRSRRGAGGPRRPGRPGSARSRRAAAGWPTGRCAGGRLPPRPPGGRAARGSGRGARRAWSRRRRGSRRR